MRSGSVVAPPLRDELGTRAIGRQVHPPEQRMASPGARELVRPLRRHQKVRAQRRGHLGLRPAFLPGEVRRLVLGIILQQGKQDAEFQVPVRQLGGLQHAVRDQDRVVGDALEQHAGACIHRQHRRLEAHEPAHVQVLQVGKRRHVAGHHFVAHQLLELGYGNLERGVQLVGRLVLRRAVGPPRVTEVIHRAREPRVLDGEEAHVCARHAGHLRRQVRHQVQRRQRVVVRDEGIADRGDGLRRHPPGRAPRVDRAEQGRDVVRRVPCRGQ